MKNKSKVVLSKRATQFKNMGGPRKYPSKYVWQIIDNNLSLQEVRYFHFIKRNKDSGFYFFTFIDGKTTRRSKVPSDLKLFDSVQEAYEDENIPSVKTLDRWY